MAYIGLISDTHGYFDKKLEKFLAPVDVVWHAGDFGNEATLSEIATFKPLVGVFGNCDGYDVRDFTKVMRYFEQDGMSVLMTHIGGILKVVHDKHYDMMVLNPGAAGIQGFHLVRTALRFRIEDGKLKDMEVGEWPRNTP